jgi:hypothetical protein
MSVVAPPFPCIHSCCSLVQVYLYLIYLTPHLLRLVLFCYIYHLKYINFGATWKNFSHFLFFPIWQNAAVCYSIYTNSLFTSSPCEPFLSLIYSESTIGGVSCNVAQYYVPEGSRFLTSTVLIRFGYFLMNYGDDNKNDHDNAI